jgi:cytochrome c553
MRRGVHILALIGLLAAVAGCGARGDAARGARLFNGAEPFGSSDALVCSACHTLGVDQGGGLGPNLVGLADVAATRVPGQSAEDYLQSSLRDTDAFLVPGYQEGIMPRSYATTLTDQEVADLVAYLLTR